MNIKTGIEKAIKGGYEIEGAKVVDGDVFTFGKRIGELDEYKALLSPSFWSAIGKVEGWEKESEPYSSLPRERMHRFIDALCDGKDLETALDLATKNNEV